MQTRLAPARISNFTACLARFKLGHHVSVGTCRRLLGLMAAASPVLPQGLLHMRPFLWWMKELRLHPIIPATHLIRVSHSCSQPLLQWRDPTFDAFSPGSRGASYNSQNGQYGGSVPHKTSGGFTVVHPGQACAPSSPLVPGQVPFFEGSSRSGSAEPCGRFSVETETQAGRVDVEPSDGIPDMESVWRSGSGPLCFSRVIPMHALVLPQLPDDSGHRCIRPSVAECQSVCVSASKADSGSPMQSKGERCPSPSRSPILALPDLVLGANSPPVSAPLGDSDQAGPAVPASGQDLPSSTRALEVVGMAHTGPRALMINLPMPGPPLPGSCTLPSAVSLSPGVWLVQ